MEQTVVVKYQQENKTPTLIARELGISVAEVNTIIDSLNIRKKQSLHNVNNGKKRLKQPTVSTEEIVKVYNETQSTYRTSEILKISRYKLMTILKQEGVLNTQSKAASIRNKGYVKKLSEQLKEEIKVVDRDVVYSSSKWSSLKALVKKHRNCKCENCGVSERLELHHILPLSLYPDAFFDVDNLKLFCEECHFSLGHDKDWLKGEFIGGSDILIEMYNSGELKEKLAVALAS